MLDFETWIDGAYVNTHGGDGLVVASSTGSTAYALSCGGPIVAPHLDVLVVAPICPHTLSDRPIVVSGRSVIAVKLIDRPDTRAQVTCDGVPLGELLPGDRLEVHPTPRKITLLHPEQVRVLPPVALQAPLGTRQLQPTRVRHADPPADS